jgi:hypothetical protein
MHLCALFLRHLLVRNPVVLSMLWHDANIPIIFFFWLAATAIATATNGGGHLATATKGPPPILHLLEEFSSRPWSSSKFNNPNCKLSWGYQMSNGWTIRQYRFSITWNRGHVFFLLNLMLLQLQPIHSRDTAQYCTIIPCLLGIVIIIISNVLSSSLTDPLQPYSWYSSPEVTNQVSKGTELDFPMTEMMLPNITLLCLLSKMRLSMKDGQHLPNRPDITM